MVSKDDKINAFFYFGFSIVETVFRIVGSFEDQQLTRFRIFFISNEKRILL